MWPSSEGPTDDGCAETIGRFLASLAAEVEEIAPLLNRIGERQSVDDTRPWGSRDEAGAAEVERGVRVVDGEHRVPPGHEEVGGDIGGDGNVDVDLVCPRSDALRLFRTRGRVLYQYDSVSISSGRDRCP